MALVLSYFLIQRVQNEVQNMDPILGSVGGYNRVQNPTKIGPPGTKVLLTASLSASFFRWYVFSNGYGAQGAAPTTSPPSQPLQLAFLFCAGWFRTGATRCPAKLLDRDQTEAQSEGQHGPSHTAPVTVLPRSSTTRIICLCTTSHWPARNELSSLGCSPSQRRRPGHQPPRGRFLRVPRYLPPGEEDGGAGGCEMRCRRAIRGPLTGTGHLHPATA